MKFSKHEDDKLKELFKTVCKNNGLDSDDESYGSKTLSAWLFFVEGAYAYRDEIIKLSSVCNHEWVSDLSEKELNSKHNIIYDCETNLPTDRRWCYGSNVCKMCGAYGGGWHCPTSPTHECEYNGDYDQCIHCGLPDERK